MARKTSGALLVVSGLEQGSVFPATREEIELGVFLDGRKEAFDVRGGVYSHEVQAAGPGCVRGPLLAGDNARFEVKAPDVQRYLGGVSALRSIFFSAGSATGWEAFNSPLRATDGVRFVIRGDIVASEKVAIQNGLVIGSITAPNVELAGSIVLGQVVATTGPGLLKATCSTIGLYDVKRLTLEGPTTIMTAGGASDEKPSLSDYSQGEHKFPFAMRMFSLCQFGGVGCGVPNAALDDAVLTEPENPVITSVPGICCEYWARRACPHIQKIALTPADFVEFCVRAGKDDKISLSPPGPDSPPDSRRRWFFGLQNRALAMQQMVAVGERFNRLLHHVFAYEHLGTGGRAWVASQLNSSEVSQQETLLLRMAIEGLESRY